MAQHAPNLVDGATLSLICGVSSSTIPHWRRSGMPVEVTGSRGQQYQYDTAKVIKWLIQRQTGDEAAQLDLAAERARLAHHQANKTRIEEELLSGAIVKTVDVLQAWQGMIGAARAKLLNLPGKLAVEVTHAESIEKAQEASERLVREALAELEGRGLPPALERALGDSLADLEAAAKAGSRDVGG